MKAHVTCIFCQDSRTSLEKGKKKKKIYLRSTETENDRYPSSPFLWCNLSVCEKPVQAQILADLLLFKNVVLFS